ncbi:hypothetical protein PsYK624_167630 [Phanerochaete sordida]|uniref:Uncharacterized protein n=1 Tax=Phanerochaete sordida TaxID=48140 RepID=A0A9P3GXJ2_9APHY|nr:hypothetical protein PsYK624_167630 [Phanerochaete sordida]
MRELHQLERLVLNKGLTFREGSIIQRSRSTKEKPEVVCMTGGKHGFVIGIKRKVRFDFIFAVGQCPRHLRRDK